jgi:hypothetical protein
MSIGHNGISNKSCRFLQNFQGPGKTPSLGVSNPYIRRSVAMNSIALNNPFPIDEHPGRKLFNLDKEYDLSKYD